jgi:hypothetical protein
VIARNGSPFQAPACASSQSARDVKQTITPSIQYCERTAWRASSLHVGGRRDTELVFTPTYASFLNRIECHFWGIGEFVVKNADYPDWDALAKAMADHIRYRNGPHRNQRLIKAERRLLIAA